MRGCWEEVEGEDSMDLQNSNSTTYVFRNKLPSSLPPHGFAGTGLVPSWGHLSDSWDCLSISFSLQPIFPAWYRAPEMSCPARSRLLAARVTF